MGQLLEEIDAAIGAHAMWKMTLRKAATQKDQSLNVDDIRACDKCRFGKWLKTIDANVQGGQHFNAVDDLHRKFHHAASDVARKIQSGDGDGALSMLENGPYTDISRSLTRELSLWKRELS